jgi:hypothetical protein
VTGGEVLNAPDVGAVVGWSGVGLLLPPPLQATIAHSASNGKIRASVDVISRA